MVSDTAAADRPRRSTRRARIGTTPSSSIARIDSRYSSVVSCISATSTHPCAFRGMRPRAGHVSKDTPKGHVTVSRANEHDTLLPVGTPAVPRRTATQSLSQRGLTGDSSQHPRPNIRSRPTVRGANCSRCSARADAARPRCCASWPASSAPTPEPSTSIGEAATGPDRFVPEPEAPNRGSSSRTTHCSRTSPLTANFGYGVRDRANTPQRTSSPMFRARRYLARTSTSNLSRTTCRAVSSEHVRDHTGAGTRPHNSLLLEPFSNLKEHHFARTVHAEVREILRHRAHDTVFITPRSGRSTQPGGTTGCGDAGRTAGRSALQPSVRAPARTLRPRGVGNTYWCAATADARHSRREHAVGQRGALRETRKPSRPVRSDVVVRPECAPQQQQVPGPRRGPAPHGHDQVIKRRACGRRAASRSRTGPGHQFHPGDRVSVQIVGEVVVFGKEQEIHTP